jgi:histidine triad (HIT) family protein
MAFDPDCAFCKIARGEEAEAEILCESDSWVAFFPLNPATTGHTLIIPRDHVRDLWDTDAALSTELMSAVMQVGKAINTALQPEGLNLITSAGEAAEQTIFHLHLHLVPRWKQDGLAGSGRWRVSTSMRTLTT